MTKAESTLNHFASPLYLDGHFDLRKIKLTSAHLTQNDKSMNARLWEFIPLDAEDCLERVGRHECAHVSTQFPPGPPWDFSQYAEGAASEEEFMLYRKMMPLSSSFPYLSSHAVAYKQALRRKETAHVEPLDKVVQQVSEKKLRVNELFKRGQYKKALLGYMECLADMTPWVASPILLTAQQCYDSGLAQLEASLWNNVYIAALKATELSDLFRASCLLSGYESVHSMHYVPAKSLYKSRQRLLHLDDANFGAQLYKWTYDTELFQQAVEAMVDKDSMAWAHERCVTEHVCLSRQFWEAMYYKFSATAVD